MLARELTNPGEECLQEPGDGATVPDGDGQDEGKDGPWL